MNPEWREFEKLIARIEQALAPSSAIVKSPDKIADKQTGELREVDASVRYKLGTSPVLITIECRDRSSVQDVRWIEELAEKKRSVGASITLAVSSSGFTDPAITKAAIVGIEIRTLNDATADSFLKWLTAQNVELILNRWELADLGIELYDVPNDAELSPSMQKLFKERGALAPILLRSSDNKGFHIENIIVEWSKKNGSFFPPGLPSDGTKVTRNLHQPMERNLLHVETTKGNFDVRVIHIGLLVSRTKTNVPVSRLTEYSDPSSLLVQTAEWNLDKMKLSLHRDMNSGETRVIMSPEDK